MLSRLFNDHIASLTVLYLYDNKILSYIKESAEKAVLQMKAHFFDPRGQVSIIRSLATLKLVCDTKPNAIACAQKTYQFHLLPQCKMNNVPASHCDLTQK